MIPTRDQVVHAWLWTARRERLARAPNPQVIDLALAEASELATEIEDEPAALFYALARRPRGLGDAWGTTIVLLAANHARLCRTGFGSGPEELTELDRLRVAIVVQRLSFEHVRRWFRARMKPVER